MRLINTKDYNDLSRKVANVIASQVVLKPNSVLGLATGSSPIGAYEQLVNDYKNGNVDFSGITTVNLDEYCGLDGTNDQSYRYFMNDNLFNHVNVDVNKTFVPNGLAADLDSEGANYDELIASLGGIDLQLLGIGHNGHIGFNEPADFFEKATHRVELDTKTREANARFFESLEAVPTSAITMGMQSIMLAKAVMIIASGKEKSEIMKKALYGPITPRVPASILQLHPNLIVVTCDIF